MAWRIRRTRAGMGTGAPGRGCLPSVGRAIRPGRALAYLCVLAWVLAGGCGRNPAYDMSSPEATVRSFFDALSKKRFPVALEHFFADSTELGLWQMRCEVHGCVGGNYRILSQKRLAQRAELRMRYQVQGNHGSAVSSRETVVHLVLGEDDRWRIARIGERIPVVAPGADAKDDHDAGQDHGAGRGPGQDRDPGDGGVGRRAARDAAAEPMR